MSLGVCLYSIFFVLLFFFLEDDSFSSKEDESGSLGPSGSDGACPGIGELSTIGVSPIRGGGVGVILSFGEVFFLNPHL